MLYKKSFVKTEDTKTPLSFTSLFQFVEQHNKISPPDKNRLGEVIKKG